MGFVVELTKEERDEYMEFMKSRDRMDEKLKKEIIFRLEDIREMLMSRGVGGERIYGCDEWSVPVQNITSLIKLIDKQPLPESPEG